MSGYRRGADSVVSPGRTLRPVIFTDVSRTSAAWCAAAIVVGWIATSPPARAQDDSATPSPRAVSFYEDVRPILTASCSGCHQPAKAGGKIVLTSHATLLAAGKADERVVVPGRPDESDLVRVITPRGERPPKMPKDRAPLAAEEVELLRRWIEQGSIDDTPAAATDQYSMDRPPVYARPPVVTALDFAPGRRTLAVSGYHEVLLYEVAPPGAAGPAATLAARLVGLSERIQTVAFSPDGRELLVVGGSPARLGEIQLWDVEQRELRLSLPLAADTCYGGSWSPDGRLVAFGAGNNTVRALEAESGTPVFFNAASEDLVLDTAFSIDGSHLVSVGRDRALKLFDVAQQQFLDNVTSITPGALKGGLMAVDRHPASDVLLIGGADGTPKLYKMHRTQKRVIGDDFNLVKAYAPLAGRIFAAEFAPDGERFVVGSSADGAGAVRLHSLDHAEPEWTLATPAAIYAVAWRSDGTLVAAGGFDGRIVLIDAASGRIEGSFVAVPQEERA